MTGTCRTNASEVAPHARALRRGSMIALIACGLVGAAEAQTLTADRAVQIALQHNSQVIGAKAGVLEARGAVYGAAAGVMPDLSM